MKAIFALAEVQPAAHAAADLASDLANFCTHVDDHYGGYLDCD